LDIAPPVITYALLANTLSTADRTLTATITDFTGVPTTGTLVPRIYYKKNAGSYFSQAGSLTSGTGTNGSWTFNILVADMGGVTGGDVISYFVIAQDTLGNIGSNPGGAVASDVNTVTTPPASPNTYTILISLSGTKTVGAGGSFDYTDLTSAITALNNGVVTGPLVFELQDSSYTNAPEVVESFPLTINANSGSSMTNTVTFKPKSGQTVGMTGSATTALFILNGADWIIFDGSNNGTSSRDLTITNTNTGTSSAVIWMQSNGVDGATNNTIKNVNLVGTSVTATAGTLFGAGSGSSTISITSAGVGNNNNTFQNNNITKTVYGIYSGGA
jgi:trimeric autotransporter adhesin